MTAHQSSAIACKMRTLVTAHSNEERTFCLRQAEAEEGTQRNGTHPGTWGQSPRALAAVAEWRGRLLHRRRPRMARRISEPPPARSCYRTPSRTPAQNRDKQGIRRVVLQPNSYFCACYQGFISLRMQGTRQALPGQCTRLQTWLRACPPLPRRSPVREAQGRQY